jgi:hypothetical protein
MNGMPCVPHQCDTWRAFSRLTGCPPPELFVIVSITSGMRSRPTSANTRSSLAMSMFPLKGMSTVGSYASSITQFTATPPLCSMFARVASKWMLLGTWSPFLTTVVNNRFSATRPWCVGITYSYPVMRRTVSSNR